jgi:hypothetical protein
MQTIEQKLAATGRMLDERAAKARAFGICVGGYINLYTDKPDVWHKVECVMVNKKLFGRDPVIRYANHVRGELFPKDMASLWDVRAFSKEMPKKGTIHAARDIEYRY